ncbi:hypothetical protein LJC22_03785 [Desulfosarcina sp. OttesenSCG-928-G10]|nr:hypothetical protein [Desulfosarcina sp. OttesenSCG-928-G10]MDL2321293.1 hypothetical protein [Desulfosarcina sp. OttesenSCG-928-B08]
MDISGAAPSSIAAVAVAAKQMQTSLDLQMVMLREMVENQQEIAQMLMEHLGQNLDVMA